MTTGLQAVSNFLVPATGSTNAYVLKETFSSTPKFVNFDNVELDGIPFRPSGVLIDNSQGANTLTVLINEISFRISCPAGEMVQMPYPAPVNHTANITGNGTATVVFVDYPVVPFTTASGGEIADPLPVSGPLTDAELRAAPVPISGALTDAQLRASPLSVLSSPSVRGYRTSNAGQGMHRLFPWPFSETTPRNYRIKDLQLWMSPLSNNATGVCTFTFNIPPEFDPAGSAGKYGPMEIILPTTEPVLDRATGPIMALDLRDLNIECFDALYDDAPYVSVSAPVSPVNKNYVTYSYEVI